MESMGMKKLQMFGRWALVAVVALVAAMGAKAVFFAADAEPAELMVKEIDYDNLTMTLASENDDARVLFATKANASVWDAVPGEMKNGEITMDISWVKATKDTSVYIKGDKSTEPVEVILPKQNRDFKVKFNPLGKNSKLDFENMGDADEDNIYWRKAKSTTWTKYNQTEMESLIESFCTKGITLYFRTGQLMGGTGGDDAAEGAFQAGMRPSKEARVKINKRAAAPKVKLDFSALTFSAKTNMQYRISSAETWTDVLSTPLNIKDVAPEALNPETGKKTILVDFRIRATERKVASQICTVEVPVQEAAPSDKEGSHVYTGSKQCKIVSETASSTKPYEYTVVKSGSTLDTATAKWTVVNKKETLISDTVAPEGSTIYFRKKATKTALPSKEKAWEVKYPLASEFGQIGSYALNKIQGVKKELTFVLYVKDDSIKVTEIRCNDASGAKLGFTSKVEENPSADSKYGAMITVTVNDTKAAESVAANLGKQMNLLIKLNNNDVIEPVIEEGVLKSGVTLYIEKAAFIAAAATYKKYYGIGYASDISFDVNLNGKTGVDVDSVAYNGTPLVKTEDYETAAEGDKIKVTLKKTAVDKLAGLVKQSDIGKTFTLDVALTNGEVLKQIKVTILYPVTVSAESASIGISKSSYEAAPYKGPEITYTLNKEIAGDDVYKVESLTWNGGDVLGSSTTASGNLQWKVELNLAKLTKMTAGSAVLTLTLKTESGKRIVVDYGYSVDLID